MTEQSSFMTHCLTPFSLLMFSCVLEFTFTFTVYRNAGEKNNTI
jgi:hypothetical protein